MVITSTNPGAIRFEVHDCREIGTESALWAGIRVWHTAKPHGLRQTRMQMGGCTVFRPSPASQPRIPRNVSNDGNAISQTNDKKSYPKQKAATDEETRGGTGEAPAPRGWSIPREGWRPVQADPPIDSPRVGPRAMPNLQSDAATLLGLGRLGLYTRRSLYQVCHQDAFLAVLQDFAGANFASSMRYCVNSPCLLPPGPFPRGPAWKLARRSPSAFSA